MYSFSKLLIVTGVTVGLLAPFSVASAKNVYLKEKGITVNPHLRYQQAHSPDNYGPAQSAHEFFNPKARDFDGDGIPNYQDKDDDNDGILDIHDPRQYG